jgi:hypothetical protein
VVHPEDAVDALVGRQEWTEIGARAVLRSAGLVEGSTDRGSRPAVAGGVAVVMVVGLPAGVVGSVVVEGAE